MKKKLIAAAMIIVACFSISTPQVTYMDHVVYTPIYDCGPPVVSVNHLDLFCGYSEEDVDLMAAVVFYEAGNQDMYGKQLVADTILNRVNSDRFPNSISEVIDQKGQFHTARKAHKLSGNAPIECYGAVISQLEVRENYEVMYFSRGYGCGKRLFKYGDHCFSGL